MPSPRLSKDLMNSFGAQALGVKLNMIITPYGTNDAMTHGYL
jgi:hypothetical protein